MPYMMKGLLPLKKERIRESSIKKKTKNKIKNAIVQLYRWIIEDSREREFLKKTQNVYMYHSLDCPLENSVGVKLLPRVQVKGLLFPNDAAAEAHRGIESTDENRDFSFIELQLPWPMEVQDDRLIRPLTHDPPRRPPIVSLVGELHDITYVDPEVKLA
jgi:hypothetical protein